MKIRLGMEGASETKSWTFEDTSCDKEIFATIAHMRNVPSFRWLGLGSVKCVHQSRFYCRMGDEPRRFFGFSQRITPEFTQEHHL